MKVTLSIAILSCLLISGCRKTEAPQSPENIEDKYAYSVGANMAHTHKNTLDRITEVEEDFNVAMYLQGLIDAINDQSQIDEETIRKLSADFQKRFVAKHRAKKEQLSRENITANEQFFAENRGQEGVLETESGLQYKIIRQGDGKQPDKNDTVRVHYRGTLLDGTEFDSSYSRNEPSEFQLLRVIGGWTEGIQLMKEGSKFEFYIPPKLAYGEQGRPNIPPNSALIFEVELLEVPDSDAKAQAQKPPK